MEVRKTKYKKEYCKELIDHMSNGFSLTSFCAVINVHRSSVYDWIAKYPEFKEARDIGFSKSLLIWERMGIDLATGISRGSARVWEINMYNRFRDEWKATVKEDNEQDKSITIKLKYDPLADDEKKDSKDDGKNTKT
jgi:hypothetical protein